MQAAPSLLSLLLILLYQSGWTHGLCNVNNTKALCHKMEDLKFIQTQHLEFLKIFAQETLVPDQLSDLGNLKHLDLSNGDLSKIEPGSFRALSGLRSLNLGENRIEYLGLASLDGLVHLRSLNLRKNAIRQLPPALARLKSLRHLDIQGNPLECNCATLKVRDLIVQRGVSVSKKIVCAGPGNMKGTSLMKPTAAIVCSFEQQDREMQRDQAHEGSGTDLEDPLNESNEDEEEEKEEEEKDEEEEEEDEYVEVNNGTSEKPKEPEIETPFPSTDSTTASSAIASTASPSKETTTMETTTLTNSLQRTAEDEEIFFDSEEKKEHTSTTEISRKEENFKDALFYPSSGDGDDGSGEGSGTALSHYDEEKNEKNDNNEEPSLFSGAGLLDAFFGFLGTTAAPTKISDPDLEEEQFIDASSTEMATKETSKSYPLEFDKPAPTNVPISPVSISNGVELLKPASADGESKSGNVKAEVDSLNDEQANVSPAKQSKKGMGSYVVLGILLAVVAGLIGFAAYRGKLCNKKRKRSDVENGTELKDMQKSLLSDAGNSTQPKIASNGNAESVPLVEGGTPDAGEDAKLDKARDDHQQVQEAPRSVNGATIDHPDPVKPPRRLIAQDEPRTEERPRVDVNSLRENFLADRTSPARPSESSIPANDAPTTGVISEPNGPPLSPGAQRVKIILQENPDSVPKTPILITRTMAGENLVKTP
ncbi:hypothetical protein HN011_000328 [Eciton burchellii]|nr:hypothetical protein HN011_000328 [Eciton burchellii]